MDDLKPAIPDDQGALLPRLARQAIAYRQETGAALPAATNLPQALAQPGAAFVSLHNEEALRGCMGTLIARKPLVESVMDSAVEAAFDDPRFEPVAAEELPGLSIHVSVLGEPESLYAESDEDLLAKLVPGEDGLILHDGHRRATFLPAVWESLPDPRDFLVQLKAKAGLMPDHWSPQLQFARYRATTFRDTPS